MIKVQSRKQIILLTLSIILAVVVLISLFLFSLQQDSDPTSLSNQEQQIPVAPSQPFLVNDSVQQPGTLLVFSNPTGARVVIDAPEEEGGGGTGLDLPVNVTPVRVESIPAGKHHLFISKLGYEFKELEVEVNPGEINRVKVELEEEVVPQPSVVDWKSKLPINRDAYTISYSEMTGILVRMRLQSTTAQEAENEAQVLTDQIKNELEAIGVPTSSEKITWEIE